MKTLILLATIISGNAFAMSNIEWEITHGKIAAAQRIALENQIYAEITEGKILAAMEATIDAQREEIHEQLMLIKIMINSLHKSDANQVNTYAKKVNAINNKLSRVSDKVEDRTIGQLDQIIAELTKIINELDSLGVNYEM